MPCFLQRRSLQILYALLCNCLHVAHAVHSKSTMPNNPDRLKGTSIASSVLDLIGNTPIVMMPKLMESENLSCILAVKTETTNPGGSSKDRPALEMILDAERKGLLKPGGVIVEPTSGNTGVGLAIVAAQRGYKCIFVTTDKVAPEKIALLKAYGSEVIVCPVAVDPSDERSYYSVALRITEELSAYRPNQYENPANPAAHENTTGPEIWEQTSGRVTHFVAGAGTSGTVTGVARYLKSKNPNIKIIVGDPDRSLFSGGNGRPYLVEGVGEDFYPAAWQPDLYDQIIPITDKESFRVARKVSREEGLLIGGSGGLAMAAALLVAKDALPSDMIVVLNPDSGRGYLSRVYDDVWMSQNGFIDQEGLTVSLLLSEKKELLYVSPETTIGESVDIMQKYNISQMPVCVGAAPFVPLEILGSIQEVDMLSQREHNDKEWLSRPVKDIMRKPLPTIGVGELIKDAAQRLDTTNALMVLDGGRSVGILSRSDILSWYRSQV